VSGESLALIPTVEAAGIPYISTASSEKIVRPVKRWTFKTAHSNDLIVSKIFDDLNKRNLKKVGLLTVATAYGDAGRTAAKEMAPKQGITLVADTTHQPQDTDMTASSRRL
jgi:branched-chain amino acid transport system substrate-binding protein